MRAGRLIALLILATVGAGCQTSRTALRPGVPPPTFALGDTLPGVEPQAVVPDLTRLATADANGPVKASPHTYRGLDEQTTQCRAAAESTVGNLLDQENATPTAVSKHHPDTCSDDLLREVRRLMALDARNRSALEALERYLQLAEAEGRRGLFLAGVASFDAFRTEAVRLRSLGLPVPKEDDLLRQRGALLADLERIEAAIALLNHDLISRLGVKLDAGERLWPVGPFTVSNELPDAEAAVARALAQRPDLQLLRTMIRGLTPDTLPTAREILKTASGLVGSGKPVTALLLAPMRRQDPTPQEKAEVESRRRQLTDLLATRETEAAAQVRTALGQLTAAANRTALLQTRVVSLTAKLVAEREAKHTADVPTIEADVFKAKADVLAAAIEWQTWRIKLKAAQGELASECMMQEIPRNPGEGGVLTSVSRSPHHSRSVR